MESKRGEEIDVARGWRDRTQEEEIKYETLGQDRTQLRLARGDRW